MRHDMVLQVTLVAELVATDRAAELLLPVVSVGQMATQVALLAQTFVADWAVELEQAAVDGGLVKAKVVLRTQHLATNVTRKLPTLGRRQRGGRLTLCRRRRRKTA